MIKNLGVAVEYLATLKLDLYNSGYAAARQHDYVAIWLCSYGATWLLVQ